MARGYWNDKEQTRKTFGATIDEPSSRRHLRTGDLGFVDPEDGCLFICGRLKNQIVRYGTMVDTVRRHIARSHELRLDVIRVVEPEFIRKTTSGKVQRRETLERMRREADAAW